MLPETVHFKTKNQVTIPKAFVELSGLKQSDILDARGEDGKIVRVPTVAIPKDQAWHWSKAWQSEELEINAQIARRSVMGPMERDQALSMREGPHTLDTA